MAAFTAIFDHQATFWNKKKGEYHDDTPLLFLNRGDEKPD
jgi:hypothetical protein